MYIYPPYASVQSNSALRKAGRMTNPEIYGWQSLYARAILETDDLMITERIYEAISAVEQRRLNPVESNSDEDCALNDAELGIKALISDRTARSIWNAAPGNWTILRL